MKHIIQNAFKRSKQPALAAAAAALLITAIAAAAPRGRKNPNEGPWNHNLVLSESRDGVNFTGSRVVVERAGVPSVTRDKSGRLVLVLQWFPYDDADAFDKVAVSFSRDDGKTWSSPKPVKFKGLPESYMRPFDPAIVLLDNGSFRMYFTSQQPPYGTPAIYSAVSKDAVNFTFEPGVRSEGAAGGVVDSSAIFWNGKWHLYAHEFIPPEQGGEGPSYRENAYHGVSSDGIRFKALDTILVPADARWIGNPVKSGATLYFYGSGESAFPATSRDGSTWKFQSGKNSARAADPAVFATTGGAWRMVSTGPLRDDASPPPFRGPSRNPR